MPVLQRRRLLAAGVLLALGYDPARDIGMLTQTGHVPVFFLASMRSGLADVAQMVAAARERNGDLAFASGGVGTSSHLAQAAIPGNIASARIRGLAVMQGERVAAAPNTPAIKARWFGAVREAVRAPALQEGMARAGIEPRLSASPAAFNDFVGAETARWTTVIREAGITAQ
jgi:tripartite-type tricarboxylate transporter receptor subunit TctC